MAYKMTPNTKLIVSLLVLVAIIIPIIIGYFLIYPPGFSPTRTTAAASSATSAATSSGGPVQVILPSGIGTNQGLNFQPATLTVAPGTTIVFVNKDTSTHDVDFTSVPSGAASIAASPNTPQWTNGQWSVTLTTPGTYTYICDYHSWMKGTITVT